jgi:hypothetical protein
MIRRVTTPRVMGPRNYRSTPIRIQINPTHKISGTSTTPVAIVKNQKIALHPKVLANTPPSNGPNAGPTIAPHWKMLMNMPRSRGSATSATAPAPMEMTAEPPVA